MKYEIIAYKKKYMKGHAIIEADSLEDAKEQWAQMDCDELDWDEYNNSISEVIIEPLE